MRTARLTLRLNPCFGGSFGLAQTLRKGWIADAFFGDNAGGAHQTGGQNSFFGGLSGSNGSTGENNSFLGYAAGQSTTGSNNTMIGTVAGDLNVEGSGNSFLGYRVAQGNTTGSNNTIIGSDANVGAGNLTNATAIGANAVVSQSNSLVLGNGVNVGIGTTAPAYKLHVVGQDVRVEGNTTSTLPRFSLNFTGGLTDEKRWQNYAGPNALNFTTVNDAENAGASWLQVNRGAGTAISSVVFPNGNVGIGTTAPINILHLNGNQSDFAVTFTNQANTSGRRGYRIAFDHDRLTFQQANDAGSFAANQMAIDQATGNVGIGTITPSHKLEVNGSVAGVGPYQDISDVRYKKNISPLTNALDKVLRLRGVSFDWRQSEFPTVNFNKGRQVGFIAQELAEVLPEVVTKDEQGYRVAYSSVVPVLAEAIKEQQQTIAQLKQENAKLKARIADTDARLHARNAEMVARLTNLETKVKRLAHHRPNHHGHRPESKG